MLPFSVDASKAGEGQLEISINDGDVPNAVQVLGGGKCLVTFTPEQAITHEIEVTFNNDQVPGSPFLCRVRDADNLSGAGSSGDIANGYDHVTVELEHLASIAVAQPAEFTIRVPEVWLFCGPFFSFLAFSVWIYFQHLLRARTRSWR